MKDESDTTSDSSFILSHEVMFIVVPTEPDEAIDALVEQLRGVAAGRGATVTKVDKMGRRRLAYPIRKAPTTYQDGFYVVLTIEGSGAEIAELERRLRVAESVMRYLTVRVDEDLTRAEKFKAKRQAKGRAAGAGQRRGRGGPAIESEVFTDAPDEEAEGAGDEEEVQ
jgi:small subunit ribosomal protein S6